MKRLPDGELEVMQAVWACEAPVQREEIEKVIRETHPMALTTLLTMLTRLSEKGFIRIEKNGRRSQYIPLVAQSEYRTQQSRSFIDRMFDGSMSDFAAALCESGIPDEDLAELQKMLEKMRK